ncbi:MAG TPA: hypothetical protein PKE64_09120 [Anaerolineae bacterium]|nr:hypothetical protein [Anaerolineae bacterium]HMR64158.1 hypothetical protein [Anaerolineae bacterium]
MNSSSTPQYQYNTAVIRRLLTMVFNDEDFTIFCYDHFPQVHKEFTRGMSFSAKVHLLVDQCHRTSSFGELLSLVRQINPQQYQAFLPAFQERTLIDDAPVQPGADTLNQEVPRSLAGAPQKGLSFALLRDPRYRMMGLIIAVMLLVWVTYGLLAVDGSSEPSLPPATITFDLSPEAKLELLKGQIAALTAETKKLEADLKNLTVSEAGLKNLETDLVEQSQAVPPASLTADNTAAILSDPSLTPEDKVSLLTMSILDRLDADIQAQTEQIESLPSSSPAIDVETQKLERMIAKRREMFESLRQIIDKYNQTSQGIIDSIGR